MRYFLLKDSMYPAGDVYRVHDDERVDMEIGPEWLPAFTTSAATFGTTALAQLEDYARKYGSLEEIDYQPEGE